VQSFPKEPLRNSVILSRQRAAKDLRMRRLRCFAVCAAQHDGNHELCRAYLTANR